MNEWISEFESIGNNCEFGFVLEALGNRSSSLLRWAFLDSVAETAAGVRSSFADVFRFENLEPAGGGTMVRDVPAGVAFHTEMRSVERDGKWVFVSPEPERRAVHARELAKLDHLRAKFNRSLAGSTIFVAKSNEGITEEQAALLFDAIRSRGDGRLLYVTATEHQEQIGTVALVRPGLAHGWIDRFAPYVQASDISLQNWERLLRSASAIL